MSREPASVVEDIVPGEAGTPGHNGSHREKIGAQQIGPYTAEGW